MPVIRVCRTFLILVLAMSAAPLYAQQTGAISGKVVDSGNAVLPGVTVVAAADVLPTPRVTTTGGNGEYRLPALPPGTYTVSFELSGMQTVTRQAQVQLGQDTIADATLAIAGVSETVTVTASVSLIDRETSSITSGVSSEQIQSLPVGQEYRDLVKLIPAVQYTEDQVRGPSAGGSGQDNVYQFDGVNVTLPLFGTLSAEPASHDIAQVTIVKGGARAVDFDRSGGFSIDSVSKSGTNRFSGQVSYQFQNASMTSELKSGTLSRYDQDRTWIDVNAGGPLIKEKLFFYGSYYRPVRNRDNQSNLYGDLPPYESTRNEGFGKLTFTPISSVLINGTYRDSKREDTQSSFFSQSASATTGSGAQSRLKIATGDASWVINGRSFLEFKYTHFVNDTGGQPDNIANVSISTDPGTRLDVGNLDQIGRLTVPTPVTGEDAFNAFVAPVIDQYGFVRDGQRVGGGTVGYGTEFNDENFFRDSGQIGYNLTFGTAVSHDLHVGYQMYVDSEDLVRTSNGWGLITVPGGRLLFAGSPVYYQANFAQQSLGSAVVPTIHSEYQSHNIEVNDTIKVRDFSFNVGLLASRDILYGQGLREDDSTISGYVLSPGTKYEMYVVPFSKMLQPRLGATWAYNGRDTVYASYARYNPAASSLPRAASWDRNLATTINAYFDQNGVLFGVDPVASSSGKLFVEDMTPRSIDEYLVGTAKLLSPRWTARLYARYRKGAHFWEDTNNNARIAFDPPAGIPRELYIPDLDAKRAQITSGSSYVIAELDGAFTKYYEGTLESEWRGDRAFVRGSYTWSHYYGNFDQDNSTTDNDANVFIGSSFIADGAGRQLWNNRYGDLRGDRRHMFKVYGYYNLLWDATVGVYAVAQSGQPWETWSYEPYIALTTSTSDTSRYAEPAGSHLSDTHYQMDLKYIQNIRLAPQYSFQVQAEVFNVFDKQTGYSINPNFHSATYTSPRLFYEPRRLQIMALFRF
jgi:hypothetical protein